MKEIFVIHENQEIIAARDTMDHAIAACMQRMAICGYLCKEFGYSNECTYIIYLDDEHDEQVMYIKKTTFKEGI